MKQPTPISKSKEQLKSRQSLSNYWGVTQSFLGLQMLFWVMLEPSRDVHD
jgi:hypothetical protein